ncbi:MAG: tetratricopeptide repeat protein [Spirochaetes bacterium]|jgi:tetratricopeptide (TPR) repeat protein|nr:tetratricopeptide repeat protein [Spirochaetota bacterium]
MRRIAIIFAGLLVVSSILPAQSGGQFEAQTEHYRVVSEVGRDHAEQTADRLEATLEIFNDYFHFELGELPDRMRVRIFASRDAYDSFLRNTIDETREDFIYLHYGNLARSELVGYFREDPDYDYSLNHQAFIQYLRSFIANPPLWLREGFAVYFEEIDYDPSTGQAVYRENLTWLDPLKSILDGTSDEEAIPFDELLRIDVAEARSRLDVFYPQSWGVVSYLMNTGDRDVNRVLWDAINALDSNAAMRENVRAVEQEAVQWIDQERLVDGYLGYLEDRRSFRGLVEDGMEFYEEGDSEAAEEAFVKALTLREDNHVPYYYLGLINYDRGNNSLADYYYRQALEQGATQALTYYALGVNAYASERFEDATGYLERAIELDPEEYSEQARQLISRME